VNPTSLFKGCSRCRRFHTFSSSLKTYLHHIPFFCDLRTVHRAIMRSTVLTLFLFASSPLATTGLATKHQHRHLHSRDRVAAPVTEFGWSLQSATCPTNTDECSNGGFGACCPKGTFCNPAGNLEVAACCPTGE